MSPVPTVAVVMPVYNAEQFVAEAIDSILGQTLPDFEFLITDNGSTDSSLKLLEAYAAQDTRIRLITCFSKQSVSRARNQLLAATRSDLIAVMDADDIALPDRLMRQVEYLQQHPEVVCVGGAHEVIDAQGRLLTRLALPETDAEIQRQALAGHGSICHPSAMIRRSALLAIGGYDPALLSAHDLDLWLKLGEHGQLANLSVPVLKYRLHSSSVSGQDQQLQRNEARQACESAWQRRQIQGQFEASAPWRPTADRASQHQFMLQYGWWAFNSGQRQTALLYALKALRVFPQRPQGWKLFVCALFKPLPVRLPQSEL